MRAGEAREAILGRVRAALRDAPPAPETPLLRAYRRTGTLDQDERVDLLARRLEAYGALVRRVRASEVGRAVSEACTGRGVRRLAVPSRLEATWRPQGVELVAQEGLGPRELDRIDGALTGCAAAVAQTGTLVLDAGPLSGRRVLTLVPDLHICVVRLDQVVELLPEALDRIAPVVRGRRAPITLVSGPSASSDIELERVEGVHGPRDLVVLIARPVLP